MKIAQSVRFLCFILGISVHFMSGITIGTKDSANGIALQTFSPSDQRVAAAGFTIINNSSQFLITRYTNAGALDATFGFDAPGVTFTQIGTNAVANAVAIQTPSVGVSAIVAAGYAKVSNVNLFALARYNSNGTVAIYCSKDQGNTRTFCKTERF